MGYIRNKKKIEANLNKPLVATLDSILKDDQSGRMQLEEIQKKLGYNSEEQKALWKSINRTDSIDLEKVKKILDKYGWLGPEIVGIDGNSTIFLVIQHSPIKTQQKYLPLMREAVKHKKANENDLAYLEDRVAIGEGRKQIYGTQLMADSLGVFWVSSLEDPDNVDLRRAKMGLIPMSEYLHQFNLKWNVEEYKKQLPEIGKKEGVIFHK